MKKLTINPETDLEITIKALSPDLLNDYLDFFDNMVFSENPHWHACYCYSFHFTGSKREWNAEQNRTAVIDLIQQGKLKGYLAYVEDQPVGWCNANKRKNYQRLVKYFDFVDESENIASVVCFLVHPDFRDRGIAHRLLERVISDYTDQGYEYLEAYPEQGTTTCEGLYKGPISMYKKLGFVVEKELDGYDVVRKRLK